ncbi:MAG: RNA-binding protein [Chloroflexota bacterium]
MNIYIGNLSFDATEDGVRELFSAYGTVNSVNLIRDKFSGQPRGFGFVEMENDSEAQNAIQNLNGKAYMNRNLTVNVARPREERGPRNFDSGYERKGNFGNDRRGGRSGNRGGGRRGW